MAKMIPPRLPIPPTAPETMPFFFIVSFCFVWWGRGKHTISEGVDVWYHGEVGSVTRL